MRHRDCSTYINLRNVNNKKTDAASSADDSNNIPLSFLFCSLRDYRTLLGHSKVYQYLACFSDFFCMCSGNHKGDAFLCRLLFSMPFKIKLTPPQWRQKRSARAIHAGGSCSLECISAPRGGCWQQISAAFSILTFRYRFLWWHFSKNLIKKLSPLQSRD